MTVDAQASPLATLQSIGIINAEHHRRALADPHAAELAGLTSLSDHLIWLIGRDIVSDRDLRNACTHVAGVYSGEEQDRYGDILEKALTAREQAMLAVNRTHLDALRALGLLTQAEIEQLLADIPPELVLSSPAEAFAYIDHNRELKRERVLEMRRRLADGDPERAELLRQVEVMDVERNDTMRAIRRSMLPGPGWLWTGAALLAVGLTVWNMVTPDAVPACDAPPITRTLNGLMLRAGIDARIAAPGTNQTMTPTLVAPKEVGYASETRVRGCTATLKVDGQNIPYAYTISGGGKQTSVTGASPAIVAARFGHLDAKGKFVNNAAPIGRAAAESALRAGVDKLMAGRLPPPAEQPGGIAKLAPSAPERSRQIAEVEPVAPCREITAGLAYSCRLLVEHNDPLMAALGANSSIELEGDFTFRRDTPTAAWAMSEQFGKEFTDAMARSRLKAIGR